MEATEATANHELSFIKVWWNSPSVFHHESSKAIIHYFGNYGNTVVPVGIIYYNTDYFDDTVCKQCNTWIIFSASSHTKPKKIL